MTVRTMKTTAAAGLLSMLTACAHNGAPVTHSAFGNTPDGKPVEKYHLTNAAGASVDVITYGGIVTNVMVPDKNGKPGDVVLGFDNLDQYTKKGESPYFGAIIGRVGNRIAKGKFTVDGVPYTVATNNGPNHLHGGLVGYDKRVWTATPNGNSSVKLSLTDPDTTEGYPGTVHVDVVYTLTPDNTLRIEYTANTDKPTPINLTNHSYWNLKDAGASGIEGHVLKSMCDRYTPVDVNLIPTGKIEPVKGTPIDFTTAKPMGQDMTAMGGDPAGYDHNLVLPPHDGLAEAVEVWEPTTGRVMQVWTTEPGVQFYSGNFLDGKVTGKHGDVYSIHHAFCFEAQHYPDSINQPNFPTVLLRPGQTYKQTTEYRFSTSDKSPF